MRQQTDEEIWQNRIETSSINLLNLGDPIPVRKAPNIEYVYLSDYVEPCQNNLYNIGDFGDCVKSFRLKNSALLARFYVNNILITTYSNLSPNQWYDFHSGFSISNKAAPGVWRYLEIEYDSPETNIGTIEVSYIQLVSYSKKHKEYVHIGIHGCQ